MAVIWLGGCTLVSINEVSLGLRCDGRPPQHGLPATQVNSAWPSLRGQAQ